MIRAGVAGTWLVAHGYGDGPAARMQRPSLAELVRHGTPVDELRRTDAWSAFAESRYLLGSLGNSCQTGGARNTRLGFVILRRTND